RYLPRQGNRDEVPAGEVVPGGCRVAPVDLRDLRDAFHCGSDPLLMQADDRCPYFLPALHEPGVNRIPAAGLAFQPPVPAAGLGMPVDLEELFHLRLGFLAFPAEDHLTRLVLRTGYAMINAAALPPAPLGPPGLREGQSLIEDGQRL